MSRPTLKVPFGCDNQLNIFGDFDTLQVELKAGEGVWSLTGPNRAKELNPDEVNTACVAFFFQQSSSK